MSVGQHSVLLNTLHPVLQTIALSRMLHPFHSSALHLDCYRSVVPAMNRRNI